MANDLLIKTEDLKQYFVIGSTGGFVKKPQYLKANNGINLEIRKNETFGLVGESGCGKSTLGRVILQLYKQTRGNTIYYGRSIYALNPAYATKYLNQAFDVFKKAEQNVQAAINGNSQLKLDQAHKEFRVIARLAGALLLHTDEAKVKKALLDEYNTGVALAKNDTPENRKKHEDAKAVVQSLEEAVRSHERFEELNHFKDGGIDLTMLNKMEMRDLRRELQIIFQDPYSSLDPRMTIGQLISEAIVEHGMFKENSKELEEYVIETMEKCGLDRQFIHRYPHQFSGGQRQRIGIARALALKPKFIVCDESVSALDVSIQAQILELLQELKEKEDLTYLFISHDLSVINNICDRVGVMYFGNMVELADSDDIFDNPVHPYTKMLLSAIPLMDTRKEVAIEIFDPTYSIENADRSKDTICGDELQKDLEPMREIEPNHFVANF
ncbi:ATP-binding cassette domain-containing protein [Carnobacteriaceae bacterium zg-ZUI252]|nr:ATP-binding cassette domain-containing protein [Carnobacteriaceae bacterium zg-ZUI252]